MLKQRLLTALVIGPLSLLLLFALSGWSFALFTAIIVLIATWEWTRLAQYYEIKQFICLVLMALLLYLSWHVGINYWMSGVLWFALVYWLVILILISNFPQSGQLLTSKLIKMLSGFAALIPCWFAFNFLRLQPGWLLYVLLLVWAADIAAYFVGRAFGKRKLAPYISPGKSWAGVYGALLITACLAFITTLIIGFEWHEALLLILISWITTAASIIGDLNESVLKRLCQQKDSSNLLPGHGGLLDRIDSLTAAIPIFALLMMLMNS